MAKSRSKRRKGASGGRQIAWGGIYAQGKRRRDYVIVAAAVIVVAVGGGLYWWRLASTERAFLALADEGRAVLSQAQSFRSEGRAHLDANEPIEYPGRFPTSGRHYAKAVEPGFYDEVQNPAHLVHAAEHGNVVIYYDQPGEEVVATLRGWARLYGGRWDGLVVTPMPGLDETVVLVAWNRRLTLDRLDPAAAATFIDVFRGRGPENRVR